MVQFSGRGSQLFALTETKLKWNGNVSWCVTNGISMEVKEIQGSRENMAILMNGMWHSTVNGLGCVISRILWVKFKFSML